MEEQKVYQKVKRKRVSAKFAFDLQGGLQMNYAFI